MDVWRPADAVETLVAWRAALERREGPSCLLLTRQAVPFQPREAAALADVRRGGYVLAEARGGAPAAVILATGSEVALAVDAQRALAAEGVPVRRGHALHERVRPLERACRDAVLRRRRGGGGHVPILAEVRARGR
jgi:transketolase